MARRATPSQVGDLLDEIAKTVKIGLQVVPAYAEQARLEHNELSGRLPTAAECGVSGCAGRPHKGFVDPHPPDFGNDPPPAYHDPTGETVVNFRPQRDGLCDPTRDLERIAECVGHGRQFLGSLRRLLNQAPAMTLAVVDGRKPSDGRSAEEHDQRRYVRVLSGEPCMVGADHEHTDRFGPGQLRRGLCDRHRKAYARWQLAAGTSLLGVDGPERLVRWQIAVYGTLTKETAGDSPAGPYKDLKEVA